MFLRIAVPDNLSPARLIRLARRARGLRLQDVAALWGNPPPHGSAEPKRATSHLLPTKPGQYFARLAQLFFPRKCPNAPRRDRKGKYGSSGN